jgi:hypothetical protein
VAGVRRHEAAGAERHRLTHTRTMDVDFPEGLDMHWAQGDSVDDCEQDGGQGRFLSVPRGGSGFLRSAAPSTFVPPLDSRATAYS